MWTLFRPALHTLDSMAQGVIASLPQVLVGLLVFWISLRLADWGRSSTNALINKTGAKGADDAAQVLGQLAYGAILTGGIVIAAAVMGVGLGRVLAGVGVSGVVVGFAFKDILENYLAGILLMLARPFHEGDYIKTGDYEGTVRVVSTRSTSIESPDGQLVVIPNAKIYSLPLTNFSALTSKRGAIAIRFPHQKEAARLCESLGSLASSISGVLPEPGPRAYVTGLDALGISVELYFWVNGTNLLSVRSELISAIKAQMYPDGLPPAAPLA